MNFFERPLDKITIDDVRSLFSSAVEEGREVEFKSRLSAEGGESDPWESGGDRVGKPAITSLVKELVAFANEQGGTLILGITQTKDKRARAAGIAPVPRAEELAQVLQQRCRDNFEPLVFGLRAKGIATEADGSGVIVIKVPSSPYGPHRSLCDLKCYRRVNDQSVPMTMDQIHRQVIELSRRTQQADQWFAAQVPEPLSSGSLGFVMRAVARPSAPVVLTKLHRMEKARPTLCNINVLNREGMPFERASVPASFLDWRPIVRGTTAAATDGNRKFQCNAWEDGSLWMDFRKITYSEVPHPIIYLKSIVGLFGNLLLAVERLRLAAEAELPYEAEFHFMCSGGFSRGGYADSGEDTDRFPPGLKTLGRYPIDGATTFDGLTRLFETDVYHHSGRDNPDGTAFDYSDVLTRIHAEFGLS